MHIVSDTPGIDLIDEIDMHLHPNWQWKVVEALETTFISSAEMRRCFWQNWEN